MQCSAVENSVSADLVRRRRLVPELEGREFHVHRSRLARVASDHLPVLARLRVRRVSVAPPYVVGAALPPPE